MTTPLSSETASQAKQTKKPATASAPRANMIRVILADDHTVVREGLRVLLDASGDIQVIGQVENGRLAVQMTKELQPDVVVMDLVMPALNGLEATRQIIKECPNTKVLILSSYGDEERVQELIEDGVSGYVVKQTAANELLKAIREAHKGNTYFSPSISKSVVAARQESLINGRKIKRNRLTTRESEVLQLVAEGYANKQIADELKISIKTVEKHRQQVMNKLNIHEVATLTRYAMSQGMIASNTELRTMASGDSRPTSG